MTTRQRLKNLFYGMLAGTVMVVPSLGTICLRYSDSTIHNLCAAMIAYVDIGILLLFVALFRCPRCRSSLLEWTHALLNASGPRHCPRCGLDLDRER